MSSVGDNVGASSIVVVCVEFNKQNCSCGEWQMNDILCRHMVPCAHHKRELTCKIYAIYTT